MAGVCRRSAALGSLLVVVPVAGNNLYKHSNVVGRLIVKFERLKDFTSAALPEARRAQSFSIVFFAFHLYPKNAIRLARTPDIGN